MSDEFRKGLEAQAAFMHEFKDEPAAATDQLELVPTPRCDHGHLLTEENIYVQRTGARIGRIRCRLCSSEQAMQRRRPKLCQCGRPKSKGDILCSVCDWQRRVDRVIRGDTCLNPDGYRLVYCPMHPRSRKSWTYEHRLIMERRLGRALARTEVVHHVNANKLDNRAENLQVLDQSAHIVLHKSGIPDERVADLIRSGQTSREIAALGVATHRIVRVRREMAA